MSERDRPQWDLRLEHGAEWSACTARGSARAHNSDAVAVNPAGECLAFAVADGVGAMEGSASASSAAARATAEWARKQQAVVVDDMPALMATVNDAVGEALRKQGQGGATTLACAVVSEGRGIVATVGDSEVLAIGPAGPALRLNELDHLPTRPNMLLAWIDGEAALEPHIIELDTLPYRLCLVTDGVAQALDHDRIADLVRATPPSEAARTLVVAALDQGAADDVTALVLSAEVSRRSNNDGNRDGSASS